MRIVMFVVLGLVAMSLGSAAAIGDRRIDLTQSQPCGWPALESLCSVRVTGSAVACTEWCAFRVRLTTTYVNDPSVPGAMVAGRWLQTFDPVGCSGVVPTNPVLPPDPSCCSIPTGARVGYTDLRPCKTQFYLFGGCEGDAARTGWHVRVYDALLVERTFSFEISPCTW